MASTAWAVPHPGRESPITSVTQLVELAVPIMAQEPGPGQMLPSSSLNSSAVSSPAAEPAHRFPGVGEGQELPLKSPRHHRPAGDQDRGDVQAGQGHPAGRDDLVAGSEKQHGVEAVCIHGQFDGVGDQVAAGENPLHALVPLGDAVAEADGVDFKRDPAPGADPLFGRFG